MTGLEVGIKKKPRRRAVGLMRFGLCISFSDYL